MNDMTIDTLAISEKLTIAGLDNKVAKELANQFKLIADKNYLTKEEAEINLATKQDLKILELSLKKEIEESKLTLRNEIIESKNSMLKLSITSTILTISILGALIQLG